jgi:hypothetical protein
METNNKITDALGNEIRVGLRYGYAMAGNGHVTIIKGVVEKINGKRVVLKQIQERTGAYGVAQDFETKDTSKSVYGVLLFPVLSKDLINLQLHG